MKKIEQIEELVKSKSLRPLFEQIEELVKSKSLRPLFVLVWGAGALFILLLAGLFLELAYLFGTEASQILHGNTNRNNNI